MVSAIEIEELNVSVAKNIKILNDIKLSLPSGKIIGFIGPSGAGKTTLIRSIVGSLKITSGRISVLGLPAGSKQLRNRVAYMTQELSVYPDLTIKENLNYFITMMGINKKSSENMLSDLLKTVELESKSNVLVSNLSSGQKQRVSLAISLIGSPELLVLDEPTVGLDPVLREKLWKLFKTLSEQGKTLIISSHSMDEASRCDYLVLVRNGKIIADQTPQNIMEQTGCTNIEDSFLELVGGKE